MHLSLAATTLGRAVGECPHCANPVHIQPSLAFYQTAAAVFVVLLLTGVVGEIREIRTQIAEDKPFTPELRRHLFWATLIFIVVGAGELMALLVLLKSPSSPEQWQQIAVGVCLLVSVVGIPLLALLPLLLQLQELAVFKRLLVFVMVGLLAAGGLYLLYTAVHRKAATYSYHVFGTCVAGSCGLNERSRPTIHSRHLGQLEDGDIVTIVCQVQGGKVATPEGVTSKTWDKLSNGHYISDVSIDTPPVGSQIPACSSR
jgi:hypothetical protein